MRAIVLRRFPAFPASGVAVAVYLASALLLFGRQAHWGRFLLTDAGADVWSSVWFLHWWPWAIAHGESLFHSVYVYAPGGYDLTWATSTPTAALLALPVTLTLGAAAAFNVLSVLAPVLSAFCAFLLVRRCFGAPLGIGLVCGFLFGFSPYEVGQLRGHLNLDLTFPIPLACLLAIERVRGRIAPRRFIACFAAVLVAEFGLSTEVFATFVSLGVLVWVLFTLLAARPLRAALLRAGAEVVAALVLAGVIILPWLVHMALSAPQFPDFINPPWMYSTNLLNLVVPTRLTALGGHFFGWLSARFSGNLSEQGGYIGLPMLAVLGLLAWERRESRAIAAFSLTTLGLAVASLGASLHVGGWDSHLPLPWWIGLHLPLLRGVMPARLSLYVALCTAIGAALWQMGGASAGQRRLRLFVVGFGLVAQMPDPALIQWTQIPFLPFFAPAQARAVLARGTNVLILPYLASADQATPAMLWQWQSGMRFRQAGGYLNFVPLSAARSQFVQHLMHNEPSSWFRNDLSAYAAATGISAVLAGPGTSAALIAALRGCGWAEKRVGGVDMFSIPPERSLHYARLAGEVWYAFDHWSWMGRRAEVTTKGQDAVLHLSDTLLPTPGSTILVQSADSQASYTLPSHGTLDIRLPKDGRFIITPGATIVPAHVLPNNNDHRALSYLISLEPV